MNERKVKAFVVKRAVKASPSQKNEILHVSKALKRMVDLILADVDRQRRGQYDEDYIDMRDVMVCQEHARKLENIIRKSGESTLNHEIAAMKRGVSDIQGLLNKARQYTQQRSFADAYRQLMGANTRIIQFQRYVNRL